MIVPIPWVLMGIGTTTMIISVPLILRMIPMNRAYGIRVRKAFNSDRHWYEINAYGGKWLFIFGVAVLSFGYATRKVAPAPSSLWAPVFLVVPLLTVLPILALINNFARRFPSDDEEM